MSRAELAHYPNEPERVKPSQLDLLSSLSCRGRALNNLTSVMVGGDGLHDVEQYLPLNVVHRRDDL